MKTPFLTLVAITDNPVHGETDTGVTRKQLRERAVVLAAHEGRAPQDASKADWEQAKRELLCAPGLGFNAHPPEYRGLGTSTSAQPAGEITPENRGWLL